MRLDHLLSKESKPSHHGEGDSQVEAFASWARQPWSSIEGVSSRWPAPTGRSVLCSVLKGRSLEALALVARALLRLWVDLRHATVLENCIASTSIFVLPSYKEPTVDALASTTDERRVRLRKATVSCLESVTNRGCLNGETRRLSGRHSGVNT